MGKRCCSRITITLLLMALLGAACASWPAGSPTVTPEGTPTQALEPSVPASLTMGTPIPGISPSTSGTPSAGLMASATPGGAPSADVLEVILSNNRTTLTLHVGQTFLLKLGDIYNWNVQVSDPA